MLTKQYSIDLSNHDQDKIIKEGGTTIFRGGKTPPKIVGGQNVKIKYRVSIKSMCTLKNFQLYFYLQ